MNTKPLFDSAKTRNKTVLSKPRC
jgi:hypothetical protein